MADAEIGSGAKAPLKRVWYRTSLFNACVIGAVGFLAPGLWNAMNSLGAGGEEKPFLVNAANALVFGLMGIFCIFGAPIANRIGLKWALLLGAAGYPVYAAGLYTNNRFGNVWLVLVGAVACGISAGLFWASEGAIAIGYPEPSKRARYLNIWVWWRTLGPIIGNSIVLALNIKNQDKGSVGYSTYIVFIVLQCLAVPVALLLTPPDKVQRADGSPVILRVEDSWKAEFQALWKTCKNRTVILLLPIFWAVYFNEYSGNFETYYFGVRARALIAFLSDWVTILASQIISHWLDWKRVDAKKRLTYGWYWVIIVHVTAYILGWVVQEQYTSAHKKNPDLGTMDYTSPGFAKGAFVLFMWTFAQQTGQNWLYYLVGSMTDNIAELTRLTGVLRGQESFVFSSLAVASTARHGESSRVSNRDTSSFNHPGLLHTATDFSRIASKVSSNTEPWLTGWYKLTNSSNINLDYTPSPKTIVYRGADGTHTENYPSLYKDIAAAYAMAIYWKVTGNTSYADVVVNILDEWSSTLTEISGTTDMYLAAGIYGYEFANVAEIMRTYSAWPSANLTRFADMMVDVFYPLNHDFLQNHHGAAVDHYWANWDLCNIASVLSIGVLTDNETMFDEGLTYFKSGAGNGQIEKAIWKLYQVDGESLGQGQEAGRDQGHSMLDFALLGPIAQTAYNQGTDLFEYLDNRILAGAEYVAKYNLGNDVPYTTYNNSDDVNQTVISNSSRGDIRPIWELLYNHYGVLKGLDVTYTKEYRDMVVEDGDGAEGGGGDYGTTSGGYDQLGWGTLMYTLE
ncbi:hypothetical protein CBS147353_748 [Aspergillus niger]|nr:hypothetical protein CBS147371_8713 [Aspergillus niger]KAI2985169.1 hypothetical protein CBS147344_6469 [Aspergillus niger]KAI2997123.1 hypothetical protein CBS147346_8946 [Aspergillus niger]KAI3044395.1 hypothetical protein CBS147352_8170 [Aspergillus niger]KAI3087830.1 hypothetical protein CBS147353_748 [Aspergillus niger]